MRSNRSRAEDAITVGGTAADAVSDLAPGMRGFGGARCFYFTKTSGRGTSPGPPQRHPARHKVAARHGPSPEAGPEPDGRGRRPRPPRPGPWSPTPGQTTAGKSPSALNTPIRPQDVDRLTSRFGALERLDDLKLTRVAQDKADNVAKALIVGSAPTATLPSLLPPARRFVHAQVLVDERVHQFGHGSADELRVHPMCSRASSSPCYGKSTRTGRTGIPIVANSLVEAEVGVECTRDSLDLYLQNGS